MREFSEDTLKITKKWEDKGRSKYPLSGVFDFVSYLSYVFNPVFNPENIFGLFVLPTANSAALSVMGLMGIDHSGIKEENGKICCS